MLPPDFFSFCSLPGPHSIAASFRRRRFGYSPELRDSRAPSFDVTPHWAQSRNPRESTFGFRQGFLLLQAIVTSQQRTQLGKNLTPTYNLSNLVLIAPYLVFL